MIGRQTTLLTIMLVALTSIGCNKMEDYVTTQEANFERYLTNNKVTDREDYDPENEVSGTVTKFYDRIDGVYRWITNESREGRDQLQPLAKGDSLYIYFDAWIFESTRKKQVFYTNKQNTITSRFPNLNTELWSTDSLGIKLGDGQFMESVERAFVGCCEGDEVEFLLTTDKAYGKKPNGVVPQYSPVAWVVSIKAISKQ
ncbi:MAG: FKBP-type peptidyl-prolyl cis-trans isomerase [Rikenellaceae bacterium]|nr:FKBP-type peptidyl-prolyl cis-trans isomerase [Rikenellaceae bacterium]